MTVPERIKVYLVKNKIKQKDLASEIKMNPDKLSQSLNNKRKLDVDEFERICEALGVSASIFISNDYRSSA